MRSAQLLARAQLAMLTTLTTLLVSNGEPPTPHHELEPRRASATSSTRPRDDSLAVLEKRRFAARIAQRLSLFPDPPIARAVDAMGIAALDNGAFRDRVARFVRTVAAGRQATCDLALPSPRRANVVISLYRAGALAGRGDAVGDDLCTTLKDATRRTLAADDGNGTALEAARFVVELPDQDFGVTEYAGHGVELTRGLVPARDLDAPRLRAQIDASAAYLQRVLDPTRGGAHKFYYPSDDAREHELHTVYTASTALTLLKIYARSGDARLLDRARAASTFMLSMQHHAPGDRASGGFFYSFDTERAQHDDRMVVGTAAKSVFTLVELHRITHDPRYLVALTDAADWLVAMQRPDGSVPSSLRRVGGAGFRATEKESLLYSGQVLSALSRAYAHTRRGAYLDAAAQAALHLADRVSANGCYLGDDYRKPNPISSSWVVLSLLDFARASRDERAERLALRCADDLLGRQVRGTNDVLADGRWRGALSSSGNGWLAEVMSEVFLYCRAKELGSCDRFRDSVVAASRLLVQYTYSRENAFLAKNPDAAIGGVFWSIRDRYVRTDAVCHATNAYLNVVDDVDSALHIAERPLADRPQQVAADAELIDDTEEDP